MDYCITDNPWNTLLVLLANKKTPQKGAFLFGGEKRIRKERSDGIAYCYRVAVNRVHNSLATSRSIK